MISSGRLSAKMISNILALITGVVLCSLFLVCIITQRRTICASLRGVEASINFQVSQAPPPFTFILRAFSFKTQEPHSSNNHDFQGPLAELEPLLFPCIYPVLPASLCEESPTSPHTDTGLSTTPHGEIKILPDISTNLSEAPSESSHASASIYPDLSEAHEAIQTFPNINSPISAAAHTLPSAPHPTTLRSTLPIRNARIPKSFKRTPPNDPRTRADYFPKLGEDQLRRLLPGRTQLQREIRDFINSIRSQTCSLTKGQLRRLRRGNLRKIWKRFVKEEGILYLRNRGRIPSETKFDLADQKSPCKYIPSYSITSKSELMI
jgi:hypothetical protein